MGLFDSIGKIIAPISKAPVLGPIAGGIIGGVFDSIGDSKDRKHDRAIQDRNYEIQKEFAQHGIRWKVEDAKEAGLNPLVAMGAQTNPAQTYVSGYSPGEKYRSFGQMGQDISRAVAATMTKEERAKLDYEWTMKAERLGLENDLLKAQINNYKPKTPPFPSTGMFGDDFATDAGLNATRSFDYKPNGSLMVNPQLEYMQKNQEIPFSGMGWAIENRFVPFIKDLFTGSPGRGMGHAPSIKEYPVPGIWGRIKGSPWRGWTYDWRYRGFIPYRYETDGYGSLKVIDADGKVLGKTKYK